MNMTEMGEVYTFLLRHRIAESNPQERQRRSSQTGLISERDACSILKSADEEQPATAPGFSVRTRLATRYLRQC